MTVHNVQVTVTDRAEAIAARTPEFVAFGAGRMTATQRTDFLADLVRTGLIYHLPYEFGQAATVLLLAGNITEAGQVLSYPAAEFEVVDAATVGVS